MCARLLVVVLHKSFDGWFVPVIVRTQVGAAFYYFYYFFVQLGGSVGDGDERHHDEVWIGFALRCRCAMHNGDNVLVDCTADSVFRSS